MTDTGRLLRDYAERGSEEAFRELVTRYIDLVYSVALRRLGGDTHLAEDIVQTVFTDLARKARSLRGEPMLGGWLHRHTCFVSSTLMRGERRRQERERQAIHMNMLLHSGDSPWDEIAPVLDEAVDELDEVDRRAVLLRFFEQRDLRAVGAALGTNEDAAQKRVGRAIEKLRGLLAKRGVTLSVTALATILGSQALLGAPAGLSAQVSNAALTSAAAGVGFTALVLKLTTPAKVSIALGVVAVALLVTPWGMRQYLAKTRVATRPAPNGSSSNQGALAASPPGALNPAASKSNGAVVSPPSTDSAVLRLSIVAADGGQPVPNVPIDYGWAAERKLKANREGVCEVAYPLNITDLQLTTRVDGFADTRLHWRPDRGEKIPTSYTLRLARPVLIGGRVVDPDDKPVGGARVGFNHEDDPINATSPENHEFAWIEVATDADGRWSINRIAPDMLRRLYGSARHSEYAGTPLLFVGRDPTAEKQLQESAHLFKLGRAVVVRGTVLDSDGMSVPGAKVRVGRVGESGSREATTASDGSFVLRGCPLGKNLLSAEADGFAATTLEVNLAADSEPYQIKLQRGKVLRLRIVNSRGEPIPNASVWLDTFGNEPLDSSRPRSTPVQVEFNPKADADGRVVWQSAPDMELSFDIAAHGYMRLNNARIRPDGEEHLITLLSALTISGTVRDQVSGGSIPRFRIVTGRPSVQYVNGAMTNIAQWSALDRFWLNFEGGEFRHSFEEPVVVGVADPSFIFKFEADGFAPYVTRTIRADEGEVRLDVTLEKAATTTVTVLSPDGRPAVGASVGLVSPGAWLSLKAGGLAQQPNQSPGTLLSTDAEGRFRLPPDDAISRVVVANPQGFADAAPVALCANPTLQLQPWGRVEGTYLSGGQPAPGRIVLLQYGSDDLSTLSSDVTAQTDAQGQFIIPQAPPGSHKLARVVVERLSPTSTSSQKFPLTEVEIRPGETTFLTLGASNCTVTVHLLWPEELKRQPNWRVFSSLHTSFPQPPAEIANDPQALARWRQTPEFQAVAAQARHYPLTENAAGVWSTEDVAPGNYALTVNVLDLSPAGGQGSNRAHAHATVTVPADPSSLTLDLGEIALQQTQ